jgi:hypothetical protein
LNQALSTQKTPRQNGPSFSEGVAIYMFEALKKLFGKKPNSQQAKPVSNVHRPERTASDAALLMTTFTMDHTSGNTDSHCDTGADSSCDSGSGGGD